MADKFVFSNFATTSLSEAVGVFDLEIRINVDDVPKFPSLTTGAKFPIVLASSDDLVEIMYVTALSMAGYATVERGQEGTVAQSWLAGTHIRHSFTAGTVIAAAGFRPQGVWSNVAAYFPGDVVEHGGVSYIAVNNSLNSAPSGGSADWQTVYQPPGAASTALNFSGAWSNSTTYVQGQVVVYQGRIWQANATHSGSPPAYGNANWTHLAKWSGTAVHNAVLALAGTNNYTATVAAADAPSALYDGMTVKVKPGTTNTAPATLAINALPATPLHYSTGVPFTAGDLTAGHIYEFIYLAATSEFVTLQPPGLATDLQALSAGLATAQAGVDAFTTFRQLLTGVVVPYAGTTVDTNVALWANGAAVSRATYANLFAKIGTTYGAGNGTTTFNLPDLRGTVPLGRENMDGAGYSGWLAGVSNNDVLGQGLGEAFHTLLASEMPVHNHTATFTGTPVADHTHNYTRTDDTGTTTAAGLGPINDMAQSTVATSPAGAHTPAGTIAVGNAGSGAAHANLQPSRVVNYIVFT